MKRPDLAVMAKSPLSRSYRQPSAETLVSDLLDPAFGNASLARSRDAVYELFQLCLSDDQAADLAGYFKNNMNCKPEKIVPGAALGSYLVGRALASGVVADGPPAKLLMKTIVEVSTPHLTPTHEYKDDPVQARIVNTALRASEMAVSDLRAKGPVTLSASSRAGTESRIVRLLKQAIVPKGGKSKAESAPPQHLPW